MTTAVFIRCGWDNSFSGVQFTPPANGDDHPIIDWDQYSYVEYPPLVDGGEARKKLELSSKSGTPQDFLELFGEWLSTYAQHKFTAVHQTPRR